MGSGGKGIIGREHIDVNLCLSFTVSLSLTPTTAAYLGNSTEDTVYLQKTQSLGAGAEDAYPCRTSPGFPTGNATVCIKPTRLLFCQI